MGISIGEIKPSLPIIYNGQLYIVVDCEHAKLARSSAFCRVKLKNLNTQRIIDCTLRDSDNIEQAFIEERKIQYTYNQGDIYHFLDLETYEDLLLNKNQLEDKLPWLKDSLELTGIFYQGKLITLELPETVELKVIDTEPGFRGDTVKAGTKPAKLETGITINVPLFINSGDIIKVNTKTAEYLSRA